MDLRISGKRAVVLGASSGIGFGIAKALAQEGVGVCLVARNEDKLEKAAAAIGAQYFRVADLYQTGATKTVLQEIQYRWGNIDILVTNNGGPPKGTVFNLTDEQWQLGYQGLWQSQLEALSVVLPNMRQQHWGRVLMVTSIAAKEPLPNMTISSAIRAGLLGLMKSASSDAAAFGITVNALLPGYTATTEVKPDAALLAKIPLGRLVSIEEQGALAAFLCSEWAAAITGQAIACDGGYLRGV